MPDISQRVASRMMIKKKALKVYTWDENSFEGVTEFDVPDELAGDMKAISRNIDQQIESDDYEIPEDEDRSEVTETVRVGADEVAVGYFGRLEMFMVVGPTAQQTAQTLLGAIQKQEITAHEAVKTLQG